MSGLGDELFYALTGRRIDSGPADLNEAIRDMIQTRAAEGKSRRAYAREIGIPESTLRRIESGRTVSAKGRASVYDRLMNAWRESAIRTATADRWRANDITITLGGFPARGRSGREETRTVTAAKLGLTPGTGERVVDLIAAGDKREAARTFVKGITDPFYRNTVFMSWIGEHDEDLAGLEYEGYDDGGSDYGVTVSAS